MRLMDDMVAHTCEHSLQMPRPFLQRRGEALHVAGSPVRRVSYDVCQELSYAVAQTVPHSSYSMVIIDSTDMTHLCRAVHCVNLPLPSLPPAYPEAPGRPDVELSMLRIHGC